MGDRRTRLAPLGGLQSQRVSDHALGGVYMRGGFNVESHDGEWWTRKGEEAVIARVASTPWWWIFDVNPNLTVIANPWWALKLVDAEVEEIYDPVVTEDVDLTNGSATAVSDTTRAVDELILVGASGSTAEAYRVASRTGVVLTLDRPYEGTTGTKMCRFLEPLPVTVGGSPFAYALNASVPVRGSAIVFEQLVSHAAGALYTNSPVVTAGHSYLVLASTFGKPVAIDLTSSATPLRDWFQDTSLATPGNLGLATYAAVYANRLFLGDTNDPNGLYRDRTIWYSQVGDFLQWHAGVGGQTAVGQYKTFDGEGNRIVDLQPLGEDLVVHRQRSQEIGAQTGSVPPFYFRANARQVGIGGDANVSNRIVPASGVHYLWTQHGPGVFDTGGIRLVARDAARDLDAMGALRGDQLVRTVIHDDEQGRLYWVLGSSGLRHQDARPATATVETPAGDSFQNYGTVFVYDYLRDLSWLEDRPSIFGGGMATRSVTTSQAHASRLDGTIVVLNGRLTGKDADLDDPTGTAQFVQWQVETPWFDLGAIERKLLTNLDLVLRALYVTAASGAGWDGTPDVWASSDDRLYVRVQVFADMAEAQPAGDFETTYTVASMLALGLAGNRQMPPFLVRLPPRTAGMSLKLRLTNDLSAAAQAAGYLPAPVRLSEAGLGYEQQGSARPNSALNTT